MKRACLGLEGQPCGVLTTGTRCPRHTRAKDKLRQLKRGDFYTGHNYRARRARAIAMQGWCSECGSTIDLTADHIYPKDPMSPLRVLCRRCNSTRANRSRVGGR